MNASGRRRDTALCKASTANLALFPPPPFNTQAQPAALRARAVDAAVGRVVKTLDWQARQRFTPLPRLRRWKRLVDWQGADGGERPILLVRAGRALQLLRPRRHAEFCDVVLSRVADGAGGVLARADRVSVVVDCRGARGLRAAWCLPLVKNLATQLHQHFPVSRCCILGGRGRASRGGMGWEGRVVR